MDYDAIFEFLKGLAPWVGYVLSGLAVLVFLGQTYVAVTPSKTDDEWLAKLQKQPILGPLLLALASLAPFKKK